MRTRTLIIGLWLAAAVAVCTWRFWEYIPGTVHLGDDGLMYGSGKITRSYNGGRTRVEARFAAGELIEACWFRADGSLIVTSQFARDGGDYYYIFREDGSIRKRYLIRGGAIFGPPTLFHGDGTASNEDEK